jgi:hypothetical protein
MSATTTRPASTDFAPYYGRYIETVPDGDLVDILGRQRAEMQQLLGGIDETRARHRYAPGKWSVAEVLGHVIDAERVFSYRAVTFARGDTAQLPSFDENVWAATSNAGQRSIKSLLEEYGAVRAATIALFKSFTDSEYARSGIASQNPVTVRALAFIIAGHERHHMNILRERYLA